MLVSIEPLGVAIALLTQEPGDEFLLGDELTRSRTLGELGPKPAQLADQRQLAVKPAGKCKDGRPPTRSVSGIGKAALSLYSASPPR